MQALAKLVKLNEDIEGEVVLSFGDIELTCFATYASSELKEGAVYLVEVEMFFVDDMDVRISGKEEMKINRVGNGFCHEVTGFLHEDKIVTPFISFRDDGLLGGYAHLEHQFVRVLVDRMDVQFLSGE